jgi:ribose-phosphate pyrophosphokinase
VGAFVVVGNKKSVLSKKIARILKVEMVEFCLDWFADTEPSLIINQKKLLSNNYAVIVLQIDLIFEEGIFCRSINDHVAGLFHLISAVQCAGAKKIVIVLPYLPYARQEMDPTSTYFGPLGIWASIFKSVDVDHIIACDMHSLSGSAVFGNMLQPINTTIFWAEQIKNKLLCDTVTQNDICIVSPDHGGDLRARAIAHELGCSHTFINKIRIAKDTPVVLNLHDEIYEKTAIIIDDILDTAHTATQACGLLRAQSVRRVFGCFTHAIFSPYAQQNLMTAGFEEIFITDTLVSAINHTGCDITLCSINDYLADRVCKLLKNYSE